MKKAEALTMNEYRQLRQAFEDEVENSDYSDTAIRNKALIELLFTLTLRVSDLLSLKVKDVVDKNEEIKEAVLTTEKKNDNMKGVFIRPKPRKALRRWLDKADLDRDDYLFSSPYVDGHLSRQQVDNIIKSQLDKVDLEEDKIVSTHSGRKTMGRRLYKNDTSEHEIREILGHKTLEQTRKYMGIFNKDLKDSVMGLPD